MNALLIYLLKSSVCLGLLFLVYRFFLRRDTFFRMNRFYLLLSIVFSLVFPLIPFHRMMHGSLSTVMVFLDTVLVTSGTLQNRVSGDMTGVEFPVIIYFTGVTISLAWFLFRIVQLFLLIRNSKIRRKKGYTMVFSNRHIPPFSFFNMIFIHEESLIHRNYETILMHERIHAKQIHTLDRILAEFLITVQWFSPFAWLVNRELKNIHEYLADEGVIRKGIPIADYQQLVLDETIGMQVNNLTNNFTISDFKNRIIMMTRKRSGNWSLGKVLLAIPVVIAAGLFFSASTNSLNNGQKQIKKEPQNRETVVPDEPPSYPGGEKAMYAFMLENIKYPEEAKKDGAMGTVFITVNVESDGRLSEVKILRGFRNDCDEEALRVVKLMPKWNPEIVKGKAVKTNFVLPIKFKLDKEKPGEKKR